MLPMQGAWVQPLDRKLRSYMPHRAIKKNKQTCIPIIIAALFTLAKIWKQQKYPWTDEWIKKIYIYIYIYILKYYSVIKKEWSNVICSNQPIWLDLEMVILSKVSQTKTNIMILLICGISKICTNKYI